MDEFIYTVLSNNVFKKSQENLQKAIKQMGIKRLNKVPFIKAKSFFFKFFPILKKEKQIFGDIDKWENRDGTINLLLFFEEFNKYEYDYNYFYSVMREFFVGIRTIVKDFVKLLEQKRIISKSSNPKNSGVELLMSFKQFNYLMEGLHDVLLSQIVESEETDSTENTTFPTSQGTSKPSIKKTTLDSRRTTHSKNSIEHSSILQELLIEWFQEVTSQIASYSITEIHRQKKNKYKSIKFQFKPKEIRSQVLDLTGILETNQQLEDNLLTLFKDDITDSWNISMIMQNFSEVIRNYVFIESLAGEDLFFVNYLNEDEENVSQARSSKVFQEDSIIRLEHGRSNYKRDRNVKRSSFFKGKTGDNRHQRFDNGGRQSLLQSQFDKLNIFNKEEEDKFFTRKNFFNFERRNLSTPPFFLIASGCR